MDRQFGARSAIKPTVGACVLTSCRFWGGVGILFFVSLLPRVPVEPISCPEPPDRLPWRRTCGPLTSRRAWEKSRRLFPRLAEPRRRGGAAPNRSPSQRRTRRRRRRREREQVEVWGKTCKKRHGGTFSDERRTCERTIVSIGEKAPVAGETFAPKSQRGRRQRGQGSCEAKRATCKVETGHLWMTHMHSCRGCCRPTSSSSSSSSSASAFCSSLHSGCS